VHPKVYNGLMDRLNADIQALAPNRAVFPTLFSNQGGLQYFAEGNVKINQTQYFKYLYHISEDLEGLIDKIETTKNMASKEHPLTEDFVARQLVNGVPIYHVCTGIFDIISPMPDELSRRRALIISATM